MMYKCVVKDIKTDKIIRTKHVFDYDIDRFAEFIAHINYPDLVENLVFVKDFDYELGTCGDMRFYLIDKEPVAEFIFQPFWE